MKNKKPAFEWVGLEGVKRFVVELKDNENYLNPRSKTKSKSLFSVQRSLSTCEESQLQDFQEAFPKVAPELANLNSMLEEALKDKTQVALN